MRRRAGRECPDEGWSRNGEEERECADARGGRKRETRWQGDGNRRSAPASLLRLLHTRPKPVGGTEACGPSPSRRLGFKSPGSCYHEPLDRTPPPGSDRPDQLHPSGPNRFEPRGPSQPATCPNHRVTTGPRQPSRLVPVNLPIQLGHTGQWSTKGRRMVNSLTAVNTMGGGGAYQSGLNGHQLRFFLRPSRIGPFPYHYP